MDNIPPEILALVFSKVSLSDLFNCELVSKLWLTLLQNNVSVWREIAKELDLDCNNLKHAKKMIKIRRNILQCRFVCSVLAVAATKLLQTVHIRYSSFNDKYIVVNWFQDQHHYTDHTEMIELKTRSVKTIYKWSANSAPQHYHALYGPHLTQTYWDYGHGFGMQGIRHVELDENDQVIATTELPKAKILIHNDAVTRQNLIALIHTDEINKTALKIQIYDLHNKVSLCHITLLTYGNKDDTHPQTSVVFKGDKIYAMKRDYDRTLIFVDINHPEEHHVTNMEILPRYPILTGVSETFMFGTTSVTKEVWCYNTKTKTVASYKRHNEQSVHDVKWYCGTLMVFERYRIVFLDPYSTGTELKVIGTLVTEEFHSVNLRMCEDGKLIVASENGSVKLLDFLNVNDNAQLLEVTGPKYTSTHNIKSYQLTEKLTHILGTDDFHSRYLNISSKERYGVVFIPPNRLSAQAQQQGPKLAVNMKRMNTSPEYNSPYFAARMVPPDKEIPRTKVYSVAQTLKSVHKVVVLFYEQFDGNNWRLSAPRDWREGLRLLFG